MWNMVWSLAGTCPFHKVIKDMYEGKHGAKRMEHGKEVNSRNRPDTSIPSMLTLHACSIIKIINFGTYQTCQFL